MAVPVLLGTMLIAANGIDEGSLVKGVDKVLSSV
jgi:hypothetical protein